MAQLIDKAALVAEIERQRKIYMYDVDNKHSFGRMLECNDLLVFIDSIETKEVDLEKECAKYFEENDLCVHDDYIKFARHFFELGSKAQKGE